MPTQKCANTMRKKDPGRSDLRRTGSATRRRFGADPAASQGKPNPTTLNPKAGLKRAERAFPPPIPAQSQCESMQNERRRIVFCRREP